MRLVPRAVQAPSCCGICGSRTGAMIDTGAEVRLHEVAGLLYICVPCGTIIASLLGALPKVQARELREQRDLLLVELDQAEATIARMRPVVLAVAKAHDIERDEAANGAAA